MNELKRITTEYSAPEDRIRLSGEAADGKTVVFWLTRRLLDRLLPSLIDSLEREVSGRGGSMPTYHLDAVHGFAQQAARAQMPRQSRVQVPRTSRQCVVRTAVIAQARDGIVLTLRGEDPDSEARVTLGAQPLRQWLNILHDRYRQATWPLDVWPDWMAAPQALGPLATAAVH
jgi:hypothetical protein